jgi:hypothetical protein
MAPCCMGSFAAQDDRVFFGAAATVSAPGLGALVGLWRGLGGRGRAPIHLFSFVGRGAVDGGDLDSG